MRHREFTIQLWKILTAFFVLFFMDIMPVSAQLAGDRQLLLEVAKVHETNIKKIKTWQGNVDVRTEISDPKGSLNELATLQFAYDAEKHRLRWNWITQIDHSVLPPSNSPEFRVNGMIKGNLAFQINPPEPLRTGGQNLLVIQHVENDLMAWRIGGFNPMRCYNYSAEDLSAYLRRFHARADIPIPGQQFSILREGDLVIIENRAKDALAGGSRMTFDLSENGCSIGFTFKDGMNVEDCAIEYKNIAGIDVPVRMLQTYQRRLNDESVWRTEVCEIRFTQQKLNEPIPESEFFLVKLGLKPGDQVVDKRDKARYSYVSEEDLQTKTVPPSTSK